MDVYTKWRDTVRKTVNAFAKSCPPEDKEDLEQECFLGILTRAEHIARVAGQGPKQEKRYVIQVCRNRISDVRKTERRYDLISTEDLDENVRDRSQESPHTVSRRRSISEVELDEAIKSLPHTDQYILRSIYFLEMSETEVGNAFGYSQQRANTNKWRAVDRLREVIDQREL